MNAFRWLAVALVLGLLGGCAFRQYVPAEKLEPGTVRDVDVLLHDGRVVRFETAEITAEAVVGYGRTFVTDSTCVDVTGSLDRADIALVQFHRRDSLGPVLLLGTVAVMAVAAADGHDEAASARTTVSDRWGW